MIKVSERRITEKKWKLKGFHCVKTGNLFKTQPNLNFDTYESEEFPIEGSKHVPEILIPGKTISLVQGISKLPESNSAKENLGENAQMDQ